ncbi:hypothetical protein SGCZBJ_13370 [Caulobacter zeae]|uniref:Uncharacterized protein n=1 Tax=Caulobacter zeae TaxID=2055137 RepID=A0A2N5DDX6_9CAUL|nr:hypothetical protein SGCZBJ_13370 [Caulobacter zeae]
MGGLSKGDPLSRSATAPPKGEHLGANRSSPLGEVARRAGGGPFSAAAELEGHQPLPSPSPSATPLPQGEGPGFGKPPHICYIPASTPHIPRISRTAP